VDNNNNNQSPTDNKCIYIEMHQGRVRQGHKYFLYWLFVVYNIFKMQHRRTKNQGYRIIPPKNKKIYIVYCR